jgi:hypothetical protein
MTWSSANRMRIVSPITKTISSLERVSGTKDLLEIATSPGIISAGRFGGRSSGNHLLQL